MVVEVSACKYGCRSERAAQGPPGPGQKRQVWKREYLHVGAVPLKHAVHCRLVPRPSNAPLRVKQSDAADGNAYLVDGVD